MNTVTDNHKTTSTAETPVSRPVEFTHPIPDQLRIREGGGVLSLFGLPFLGAGLFLFCAALGLIPFSNASEIEPWMYGVMAVMGMAFTAVGGGLVFGRRWTTLDRAQKTLVKSRGLLIPMMREESQLNQYAVVVIRFDSGDSDSSDRFPVALHGDAVPDLVLLSPTDYGDARRAAVYVAEFLNWPMEDASSDTIRRISPDQLSQNLYEHLQQDKNRDSYVPRPFTMRSSVDRSNGELKVTIPAQPFTIWRAIPSLVGIGVAIWILSHIVPFLEETDTPTSAAHIALFVLGFFFVGVPLLHMLVSAVRAKLGYTRLTITRQELSLVERGLFRRRKEQFALSNLVDIDCQTSLKKRLQTRTTAGRTIQSGTAGKAYSPGQYPMLDTVVKWVDRFSVSDGIIFKTTGGLHAFGAGLPDDELAHLAYTIREYIRGIR